jgi:hypothetical protein
MGSIQSSSDTGVRRESTSKWEHALRLAKDCLDVFQHSFENIEDIEKNGKEALELLAQRHVFLIVLTSNVLIRTIVFMLYRVSLSLQDQITVQAWRSSPRQPLSWLSVGMRRNFRSVIHMQHTMLEFSLWLNSVLSKTPYTLTPEPGCTLCIESFT